MRRLYLQRMLWWKWMRAQYPSCPMNDTRLSNASSTIAATMLVILVMASYLLVLSIC